MILFNFLFKLSKTSKTYANRSAAYLELEMFHKAFLDAQESVDIEPSEKAYYRMGRSLYSMRQFSDALDSFQKCLELNERNSKAREGCEKCLERIRESQTGEYEMKKLINDVKEGKLRLDVADYLSSSIRIEEDVNSKGKVLMSIEDIKRGTLLTASKAVSIVYECECNMTEIPPELKAELADRVLYDQSLSSLFFRLQNNPFISKQVIFGIQK